VRLDTDILIVGSGTAGATVAKELARQGKEVVVLEKGKFFPQHEIGTIPRAVRFYDNWGLWSKSREGVIYYRCIMAGGTSISSCANGMRSLEKEFKALGINLNRELAEAEKELNIRPVPERLLKPGTRRIMAAAAKCGVDMVPMPKFINFDRCISCGKCVLGCKPEVKWTALDYLEQAQQKGASLVTKAAVTKVKISGSKAVGVEGYNRETKQGFEVFANKVILSAGGIGTPLILQNSGIAAGNKFFLDLFNVTVGLTSDVGLTQEIPMAAVGHHPDFVLAPFLDNALALAFVLPQRPVFKLIHKNGLVKVAQRNRMLGIMVKIKDDSEGRVHPDGLIEKPLTVRDKAKLNKGATLCAEILIRAGVKPKTIITTKVRGAHPGGTSAIGEVVNKNLETKIKNLYVCDASVLPEAPGLPPIVTIIALAKRFARQLTRKKFLWFKR